MKTISLILSFITIVVCFSSLNAESITILGKDSSVFKLPLSKVQIYLDRAGFSPGEIDDKWGTNLHNTIKTFQKVYGLPTTGEVDKITWDMLTINDPVDPFTTYTLSSSDVSGPFLEVLPDQMDEKAELDTLGYTSLSEMLGEKFHCSPFLLWGINTKVKFVEGATLKVPNVRNYPFTPDSTLRDLKIVVSTKSNSLDVLDTTDRIIFHAPISPGGKKSPPPYGEWTVQSIVRNPTYFYNPKLFWDADRRDEKKVIPPGPNNPVGNLWIDLSINHYGIHGTPAPANIGHGYSHGCIRLTNWDVRRVAKLVHPGTAVIIRD